MRAKANLVLWCCWLVCALLLGLPSPILAQVRYLPLTEYERADVRTPQSLRYRYEQMVRTNDFELVANLGATDRYRQAGLPVGRLKIRVRTPAGQLGVGLCTASLVTEDMILTNYHCIPGLADVRVEASRFELGYLERGKEPTVYEVRLPPVEVDAELDYALLGVQGHPGKRHGVMTLSQTSIEPGQLLAIIHHPEGRPQTLSRRDCHAERAYERQFIHSCDTLGGSSGSPVLRDDTLEVIGLHFAGGEGENFAQQIRFILSSSPRLRELARISAGVDVTPATSSSSNWTTPSPSGGTSSAPPTVTTTAPSVVSVVSSEDRAAAQIRRALAVFATIDSREAVGDRAAEGDAAGGGTEERGRDQLRRAGDIFKN